MECSSVAHTRCSLDAIENRLTDTGVQHFLRAVQYQETFIKMNISTRHAASSTSTSTVPSQGLLRLELQVNVDSLYLFSLSVRCRETISSCRKVNLTRKFKPCSSNVVNRSSRAKTMPRTDRTADETRSELHTRDHAQVCLSSPRTLKEEEERSSSSVQRAALRARLSCNHFFVNLLREGIEQCGLRLLVLGMRH